MDRRSFLQGLATLPFTSRVEADIPGIGLATAISIPEAPCHAALGATHASRGWRFQNFFSHSGVAHARAMALRYSCQRKFNSVLLILGSSGNGRSHLAYAIARALRANAAPEAEPRWIACINGAQLCSSSDDMQGSLIEPWRADGGIVVDDAHCLLNHMRYGRSLNSTIDVLCTAGRPVVLTIPLEEMCLGDEKVIQEKFPGAELIALLRPLPNEAGRILHSVSINAGMSLPRETCYRLASENGLVSVRRHLETLARFVTSNQVANHSKKAVLL